MRLSIIVPVYNAERYLERCLTSLVGQKMSDYEIILVDDGSTDASGAICDQFAEERAGLIRVFHKANGGQGAARNAGLSKVRGKYLTFVDSDDYVAENCYPRILRIAESGDYDVIQFDACRDYGDRTEPMEAFSHISESREMTPQELALSMPSVWDKLVKTDLVRKNSLSFPEGIWYEDLALVPQLAKYARRSYYLKECYYHYVQSEDSITRKIGYREKWWDIAVAVEILRGQMKRDFPREMEYIFWEHFLFESSLQYYRCGRFDKIDAIAEITRREYPNWAQNKYVKQYASLREKTLSYLFYHKKYSLIASGQRLKEKLKG